jgi:hypothetical protein
MNSCFPLPSWICSRRLVLCAGPLFLLLFVGHVVGAVSPVAERSRFAYAQSVPLNNAQELVLAGINPLYTFPPGPTASIVRVLHSVAGPGGGPAGQPPETYSLLLPSPSNRYLAVLSDQLGTTFRDANINIYDLRTGLWVARFNEHSFGGTDRSTCVPPVFQRFLDSEAALGVPPATLAAYNYRVEVEGTGFAGPWLTWTADESGERLLIRFEFNLLVLSGPRLAQDSFEFEIQPAERAGNQILSCNAGLPSARQPAPVFAISGALSKYPGRIIYRKSFLSFVDPIRGLPLFKPPYMPALRVAGNVFP